MTNQPIFLRSVNDERNADQHRDVVLAYPRPDGPWRCLHCGQRQPAVARRLMKHDPRRHTAPDSECFIGPYCLHCGEGVA